MCTRRFFLVASLFLGMTVASVPGVAGQRRPGDLLKDIRAIGAKATLNELYRDDTQWTALLRGIASGVAEWFAVAEALRPAADAHVSEALDAAFGEALGTNAQLVLSNATGPFFLSATCTSPDVDDERFDTLRTALAELNRRIRGVERVKDPELALVRTDCLDMLRGSEPQLRRFFGKP
jgi:hypothetical protein